MRPILPLLLFLGASLSAQTSYVSPLGAEFFEGGSYSGISFGFNNTNTQSRIQTIDLNLVGRAFPIIRSIAWRRDVSAPATATARQADVELLMAHGDFNAMTTTFANNYKDNPVTVFRRKSVNLPDWTVPPNPAPALFDLVLAFDVPFIYNRVDGLLFETVVQNLSNPSSYRQDFLRSIPHAYGEYPTELAMGCLTASGRMRLSTGLRVNANRLELPVTVSGAPPGAAVLLFLGSLDPNASVPGLCTTWHTNALTSAALPRADAAGVVPLSVPLFGPWNSVFAGVPLYCQAAAIDPTQTGIPIALSSGLRSPCPTGTTNTPVNVKNLWNLSNATAATGNSTEISAIVVKYGF